MWWRIYVCTPDDCPLDGAGNVAMRDGDLAVTIFNRRWICLNPLAGEHQYLASLVHEFQHVEQHNEGLYEGDSDNARMHRAIENSAVLAAKLPRKFPPRLEDHDD